MTQKNKLLHTTLLFGLAIFYTQAAFAWTYMTSLGYGFSKESYYNQQGAIAEFQAFPFEKLDKTLKFGFGGSIADWLASSDNHKNMATAAVSGIFRAYFIPPEETQIFKPYLTASFGPAYLAKRQLGNREQGSHFSFQTIMGAGTEVKIGEKNLDFSLKFVHYCNGGLFKPNQGIDVWYIFSIGYLFG